LRKAQKGQVIDELQQALAVGPHIIVTGYRGLTVKDLTQLRRTLGKLGAKVKVVKKTLFRRALGDDARAGLAEHMEGPVAVTFVSGDAVSVLKEMSTFAKTHNQLEFRGGWVGSQLFDARQVVELATLPPREELLGRLVGVLSAPLSQLVGTLQAGPRDLVLTIQAIIQQREEAGAAPAAAEA
jgi:large subunit ribosomal protein L10